MSQRFGRMIAACALVCTSWAAAEAQQYDSAAARAVATRALRDYYGSIHRTYPLGIQGGIPTPAIGAAAQKLWTMLDSAVQLSPSDREVVSVAVYHAAVGPDPARGVEFANTNCIADDWWCNALKGFAYHNVNDFVASERHYDRALTQMPPERRCLWEDISNVMNDRAFAVEYRRFKCAERDELNARIWWLADPMWMVPGNDRRTEHYSRWMTAELVRVQLEMLGWRRFRTDEVNDQVGAIIRFGPLQWYGGFNIGCSNAGYLGRLDCELWDTNYGRWDRFIVRREAAANPYTFGVFDVQLGPLYQGVYGTLERGQVNADTPSPPASRTQTWDFFGEGYPSDVGMVHVLNDAQVAMLLRSDSSMLLTAFRPHEAGNRVSPDPVTGCCTQARSQLRAFPPISMAVAIAISGAPGDSIHVVTGARHTTDLARLSLYTRYDSALVSLEAHSNQPMEYPVAVRHRFAVFRPDIGVTGRLRSSDLVLFDATSDQLPTSASEVHALMLPRSTVDRDTPVGIYWETYGAHAGEVVDFELSVTPRDTSAGLFRSLAQAVGLASQAGTVLMTWKSPEITAAQIGEHTETPHALRVDLRHLRPGNYELGLSAQVPGDSVVKVTKHIRVR